MAHYGTFREQLAISYPTYGNALWEPAPGGQYDAVEVGDVGFIRRGYFQRLFNVLLPKDHPSHRNPSFVPENHQQLDTIRDHIVKNEIRTGSRQNSIHFCSQFVTLESRGRGTSASGPEDDSQITFSCNGKHGALLSLPVPAQAEDTVAFGDFGKWMIKHIDTWFAFARGLGLGINRMEDIILVTGRHLTKSWVNVAFTQRRPDAGVSFDVQVSGHSHVSLEQEYVRGGDLKLGPTGRDLPENQCIFIRGFRVVRILGMWPKLRGQAGPAPDAGNREPEPESDPKLELISVPDDSNDPLQDLLQYVTECAPDCDMALVHDNDLACLDVALRTALRPRKFSLTFSVKIHLRESVPTIQNFQCELLSDNKSGPGADVAVAKVATLSEHAFETPRKESDLSPVLAVGGATDRLDSATYEVELKRIETEIGLLHETLAVVNGKVSDMALANESFTAIRAQIKDLHHSNIAFQKAIRNQISDLRHSILDRERNLSISQEHKNFRTVEDVDAHIRTLEARMLSIVPAGTEEMVRILRRIADAKRIREVFVTHQADFDAIDAMRAAIENLKKQLDDPEREAFSKSFYALEAEKDVKGKKGDLLGNRSLMFEQQRKLQRQINTLFSERYDLISRLRKDDTRYYAMLNEDRDQPERWCAEREAEIDDCQMLIEYFSDFVVPPAETREEEKKDHPVHTKDRNEFKKSPKAPSKAHSAIVTVKSSSPNMDLPLYTRSILRSLSILPPSSPSDVPRVVENLKMRKTRLEEIVKIQQSLFSSQKLLSDDMRKPTSENLQETEVS